MVVLRPFVPKLKGLCHDNMLLQWWLRLRKLKHREKREFYWIGEAEG
jgi:hypothetical protein